MDTHAVASNFHAVHAAGTVSIIAYCGMGIRLGNTVLGGTAQSPCMLLVLQHCERGNIRSNVLLKMQPARPHTCHVITVSGSEMTCQSCVYAKAMHMPALEHSSYKSYIHEIVGRGCSQTFASIADSLERCIRLQKCAAVSLEYVTSVMR